MTIPYSTVLGETAHEAFFGEPIICFFEVNKTSVNIVHILPRLIKLLDNRASARTKPH